MEVKSHNGFALQYSKIPITIRLKKLVDLKPHEETVDEEFQAMLTEMRHETVLRHPIITDASTGLILDGTHRTATLKALGYEYIPVAELDYQSPLITLSRWFRIIDGERLETFIGRLKNFHPESVDRSAAEEMLRQRKTVAILHNLDHAFIFPTGSPDSLHSTHAAFKIEQLARNNGLLVGYADVPQLDRSLPARFVLTGVQVGKDEVLDVIREASLYPPKTTRHLIPSRPLSTRTPFEWLRGQGHAKAEEMFQKQLQLKTVRKLPPGSWVGSRRYQEEVFLFE